MYFFLIRLFTIERKADKLPIDWIRSIGAEILWKFFLIFKSFFSGGRNWQKIPESLIKKKTKFYLACITRFFLLWLYFKRWYHNCLFLCCFSDTSNTSIRFRLYRNFISREHCNTSYRIIIYRVILINTPFLLHRVIFWYTCSYKYS